MLPRDRVFRCGPITSCASTCDGTDAYACGEAGFDCSDVNATDFGICPPFNADLRARVGNGVCDLTGATLNQRLNVARCNWDGGDWCVPTWRACRLHDEWFTV